MDGFRISAAAKPLAVEKIAGVAQHGDWIVGNCGRETCSTTGAIKHDCTPGGSASLARRCRRCESHFVGVDAETPRNCFSKCQCDGESGFNRRAIVELNFADIGANLMPKMQMSLDRERIELRRACARLSIFG
jgi:hypothetical protein